MPTTSNANLPYPSSSASDNVPYDMQQLADALDALLGSSAAVVNITLGSGFSADSVAGFKSVKKNGVVYCSGGVSGSISAGASAVIGTLAADYRPTTTKRYALVGSTANAYGRIEVSTSGDITVSVGSSSAATVGVNVAHIIFPAGV